MNKKLGIAMLGVATLATIGGTFAYQGQGGMHNVDDATRTAIHDAVIAGDYDAFISTTQENSRMSTITEAQFQEMVEKMSDREANQQEREVQREEVQAAIEEGDYDTWKSLAPDFMLEKIDSEDKFEQLQEMHAYMEKARAIGEELGLPQGPRGEHRGQGQEGGHKGPGMGSLRK